MRFGPILSSERTGGGVLTQPRGSVDDPWRIYYDSNVKQVHPRLPISNEQLDEFCQRWHVIELALFGSVTRDDYRPDSDIDVMVQFSPDADGSLWDFVDMRDELAKILGREVDLVTKGTIKNPYRKASIEKDLTVIYAA